MAKYVYYHPMGLVLYSAPSVAYQNHLCEFWLTSRVSTTRSGKTCIVGTINNTNDKIVLTLARLKENFELDYRPEDAFEPAPTLEESKTILSKLGYTGKISGSVKIGFLSGI